MVDWGKRVRANVLRTVMVAPPSNSLVRLGISVGVTVLRMLGGDVRVYDTLQQALGAHGTRPALR